MHDDCGRLCRALTLRRVSQVGHRDTVEDALRHVAVVTSRCVRQCRVGGESSTFQAHAGQFAGVGLVCGFSALSGTTCILHPPWNDHAQPQFTWQTRNSNPQAGAQAVLEELLWTAAQQLSNLLGPLVPRAWSDAVDELFAAGWPQPSGPTSRDCIVSWDEFRHQHANVGDVTAFAAYAQRVGAVVVLPGAEITAVVGAVGAGAGTGAGAGAGPAPADASILPCAAPPLCIVGPTMLLAALKLVINHLYVGVEHSSALADEVVAKVAAVGIEALAPDDRMLYACVGKESRAIREAAAHATDIVPGYEWHALLDDEKAFVRHGLARRRFLYNVLWSAARATEGSKYMVGSWSCCRSPSSSLMSPVRPFLFA